VVTELDGETGLVEVEMSTSLQWLEMEMDGDTGFVVDVEM
jgi:hypothetical protein